MNSLPEIAQLNGMICRLEVERGFCARKIADHINYTQKVLDYRKKEEIPVRTQVWG